MDEYSQHAEEIERLMSQITCNKGFRCVKTNFNVLCKAKQIFGSEYLICLEKDGDKCVHYKRVNNKGICYCPLRKFSAKIVSA